MGSRMTFFCRGGGQDHSSLVRSPLYLGSHGEHGGLRMTWCCPFDEWDDGSGVGMMVNGKWQMAVNRFVRFERTDVH
jgi:hypothetical protein